MKKQDINKVVLAYSGGLDTSVMAHWIKNHYDCEVIGFTADIGQGAELEGLEAKAIATGCSKLYVEDLRETFVQDYVWTALKAAAVYEGHYLLGTSVARPVIAKKQIEIAQQENADAVCHGATGKGNDQVRFELGYYALMPEIKVLAPWRDWPFGGRSDLMKYAASEGIPITASLAKPYSVDSNLMHSSYEGGILEDPWATAPEDIYLLTRSLDKAEAKADEIVIAFEKGVPTAIDGQKSSGYELLSQLNELGGRHGIGRIDIVENRFVGMKSRGVYETPGMTILHQAHRALETIALDREVMRLRDSLGTKIAELIYNGFWFSPEFTHLEKLIDDIQQPVTGEVKLKLFKGNVITQGRRSPNSLYSEALATFEKDEVYHQKDAEGFIKLNALRLRLQRGSDNHV